MQRNLLFRTAPLALLVALSISACGSEDEPTPAPSSSETTSETPSETPSESETPTEEPAPGLAITVAGDSITPNGERIELAIGEEITIEVTADEAGSFHVHSTPEQEVDYAAGTSTHTLSFERPGVVEMESHDPDLVIAQFEVS